MNLQTYILQVFFLFYHILFCYSV